MSDGGEKSLVETPAFSAAAPLRASRGWLGKRAQVRRSRLGVAVAGDILAVLFLPCQPRVLNRPMSSRLLFFVFIDRAGLIDRVRGFLASAQSDWRWPRLKESRRGRAAAAVSGERDLLCLAGTVSYLPSVC